LNEKKAENMEKSEKEGAGMAEKKILIVEDDRGLNQGITLALHAPEYRFYSAYNLKEARRIWKEERVSLIILDINLPDGSGYTFLEEIRRESEVPVIMLTANDLEIDQVTGFSLGADDYITKPFSLMILRARVERMLARMAQDKGLTYEKDGYRFVFEQMYFTVEGQEVTLSKTEQKLLRILIEHQGQTLTREQLVDRIWSDGAQYVEENALSVTVGRLRKKLEQTGKKNPIQTVYGLGYVWER
jgi:DNA-binding response OmpR family regulator